MITIKRLSECSLEDVLRAWNEGFEGYSAPVQMDMDSFLARVVSEGLSPSLSIVAYSNDRPIGILLSGIRTISGKKVAWNGGTAVAKDFRHQGIGKLLMEELFTLYENENVEIASLEALYDNEKAISLYKGYGYEVVDELHFLELKDHLNIDLSTNEGNYTVQSSVVSQLEHLPFYKGMNPWQTHWRSAKDAQVVVAIDENLKEVGYAYYRKAFDHKGEHVATVLFQCETDPSRADSESIVNFLLKQVFGTFSDNIRRVIPNLPINSSNETYERLSNLGFKTIAKQVYMMKNFS